jgi:hypothetical protein
MIPILWMTSSAWGGTSATHLGPSFSCSGNLTGAENVICNDVELSVYDRAMAWAYVHDWGRAFGEREEQRQWLAQRNSCANNRDCLISAYRSWIGELDPIKPLDPTFERRGRADNQGDDLLLGELQSPTGYVSPLEDSGSLFVHELGEGWFVFQINATHSYDPHDGRGLNVSTGEAVGVVHLAIGRGIWISEPSDAASCRVKFNKLSPQRWQIEEDGGGCSGIGATLTGIYRR